MTLTVTITTGNAAFGEDDSNMTQEVVRILRDAADRILDSAALGYAFNACSEIPLTDLNGNRVGAVTFDTK